MAASGSSRPSLGKALLVVVVLFALLAGAFLVAGVLFTWGLLLLPVVVVASVLVLVWSLRRRPPTAGAGTATP